MPPTLSIEIIEHFSLSCPVCEPAYKTFNLESRGTRLVVNLTRLVPWSAKLRLVSWRLSDGLSAIDTELVLQAAALALRKPRSAEDVVRHANAIDRLLRGLAKRHGRRPERRALHTFLEAPQG